MSHCNIVTAFKRLLDVLRGGLDDLSIKLDQLQERLNGLEDTISDRDNLESVQAVMTARLAQSAHDELVKRTDEVAQSVEDVNTAFTKQMREIEFLKKKSDIMVSHMPYTQHGHQLLVDLIQHLGMSYNTNVLSQKKMVEIGTTREVTPSMDSTSKLVDVCQQYDINFTSIDADERNTVAASERLKQLNYRVTLITGKGEDVLPTLDGLIDFAYIDAYDFDHDNHSEVRQDLYKKIYGNRINDDDCANVHLSISKAIIPKMSPNSYICFDDTWLDNGEWTYKGRLAVPYLIENGYTVIRKKYNGVLLVRGIR